MVKPLIFCDLDDVLADFINPALALHGSSTDLLPPEYAGKWALEEALGIPKYDFWEPIIQEGESFWLDRPLMPHAEGLLDYLTEVVPGHWYIVSAVGSKTYEERLGKLRWVEKNVGLSPDRVFFQSDKDFFARPGSILIDDKEANVEAFIKAGGQGVLFPGYCNNRHDLRHNPLNFVMAELATAMSSEMGYRVSLECIFEYIRLTIGPTSYDLGIDQCREWAAMFNEAADHASQYTLENVAELGRDTNAESKLD